MLTRCVIRASMVAAALLCATAGQAAEKSATESVTHTLLRSGASLGTHESLESCRIALQAQRQLDAPAKTRGQTRYVCRTDEAVTVIYGTAPTCAPPRAPIAEVVVCPSGTTGAYTRTKSWSAAPHPQCEIEGEWVPAAPSAEQCPPIDTDNDGVPDEADECPTVPSTEPDGCPASPPDPELLPAPADVRAQGASTSTIRVEWDAVAGASAYSLERCIGATCTTFSQLLCVTGLTGTHSSLPANLTARYRVRASRDAVCGTAAGNLGEYSAIASGTTLHAPAPTPVDCAVSAWSAWSAGAWSACSTGQQSRTETRTRTVTTQPANGGTACPALTETRTVTQACSSPAVGTASLSWTPPTTNTNGSSLSNLAGYRISYGTSPDALPHTVQVANPSVTNYTIGNLAPGTWYFAVRAYTSGGNESAPSNVVSKTHR